MTSTAGPSPGWISVRAKVQRKQADLPCYVVLPASAVSDWRLAGTTPVDCMINGVAIGRRNLKQWDAQRWFVDLTAANCRQAGAATGEVVSLQLARASTELPPELASLLEGSKPARDRWGAMSASEKRMFAEHVRSAKREPTRQRRAARLLDRPG